MKYTLIHKGRERALTEEEVIELARHEASEASNYEWYEDLSPRDMADEWRVSLDELLTKSPEELEDNGDWEELKILILARAYGLDTQVYRADYLRGTREEDPILKQYTPEPVSELEAALAYLEYCHVRIEEAED